MRLYELFLEALLSVKSVSESVSLDNRPIFALVQGVIRGKLLIHVRSKDGTDFKFGIDPSAGEFLRSTEDWQNAEETHGAGPELTFFSDDFSWALSNNFRRLKNATELQVVFVKKNPSIVQYIGNGNIKTSSGITIPYNRSEIADYDDPNFSDVPGGVESGDWFTKENQDVLGVVNLVDVLDVLKKLNQNLKEVHWQDLYPDSFKQFRKKYLPLLRARQVYNLYVQFSNFANNTMDRNASPIQDHHDPAGVYAYPIAYVLQHPADVWYGQGAKYMRVLRAVSKKSFSLAYIDSESKCERMLNQAGFAYQEIHEMMWLARKHYKSRTTGTNKWAKVFLSCMQIDLIAPAVSQNKPGMFSKGGPEYRIRTGQEQTALFLKMGVDSLIDSSSTHKSAIINDREPEQICFLNRAAFRVEEVFDLRGNMPKEKLPTFTHPDPSGTYIERALVATIAKSLNDQISESSRDMKTSKKLDASYRYYWTKKGRRIEIRFERPPSYYENKKMGEKKHKADKLYSSYRIEIEIETEFGQIKRRFAEDTPFHEIISDITRMWMDLEKNPQPTGWEAETADSFMVKVKADKDEYYRQEQDKKQQKLLQELPTFLEDIDWVAKHYGMNFVPNKDYEKNCELIKVLEWFSNHWRQKGVEIQGIKDSDVEILVSEWEESVGHWFEALNKTVLMDQVHQIGELLKKAAPENVWEARMGGTMFMAIKHHIEEKTRTANEPH